MTVSSVQQDAKYTQGFVFEHDALNAEYARAVVERSCTAVISVLHDVFATAEKAAFEQAVEQTTVRMQNRGFIRLAEIVNHRAAIESALIRSVVCAYAQLTGGENASRIEDVIRDQEKLRCETLDLPALFAIDQVIHHATDRNRPFLLNLNAQLALLFCRNAKRINCNPLSPATLVGGFTAGLLCVDMDIAAKKILFRSFEQEFLSKLSMLINNVTARLEQENLLVGRAIGFDEDNAGPIRQILANPSTIPMTLLQGEIDKAHKTLATHRSYLPAENFYELSGEESIDSTIELLSDMRYYLLSIQSAVMRQTANVDQTAFLQLVRSQIAESLNQAFTGKFMPLAIRDFLQKIWVDVLFDIRVISGASSEPFREALALQQALLETVTPTTGEDQRVHLNRQIPAVVRMMRGIMEQSGFSLADISLFMDQLKDLHFKNIQQKLDVETFVPWTLLPKNSHSLQVETIMGEHEQACFECIQQLSSALDRQQGNSMHVG